ncbi:MAG: 5-(carboxyamino)imidazole ribonucleotide mutase [Tepidisphaeraceae bacterium]|jgi:5-(carboxyamino)imidazole ribonucleotide mutase
MATAADSAATTASSPLVCILMGSKSDWEIMRNASDTLKQFGVPNESRVISAHRAPAALAEYVKQAEARGAEVIIAGAGGAAHLPGVVSAYTLVPVLGVPMLGQSLAGLDALLAIVQMPAGVPVGTLAVGKAGAVNAALLAVAILSNTRPELREKWRQYRKDQEAAVLKTTLDA